MKKSNQEKLSLKLASDQVYYLVRYGFGPDGDERVIHIGVFNSKSRALAATEELKTKEGFNKSKGRFWISKGLINSVQWAEGFIDSKTYLESIDYKDPD
jgi:hypothetical protein